MASSYLWSSVPATDYASQVGLALVVIAFAVLGSHVTYQRFFSPLKRFPGPWLCSVSSLPYDVASMSGIAHHRLQRWHDKYGPVVRIRPNEISWIDGSVWKDAWGFRSGHAEFPKSETMTPMNGVHGILSSTQDDHRRFRRLLAYAFSNQGLKEQEPRMQSHIASLMTKLSEHGQAGPIDISKWFTWMALDIISDLAFGSSFDSVDSVKTHPWMAATHSLMRPTLVLEILRRWGLGNMAERLIPKGMLHELVDNYQTVVSTIGKRMQHPEPRGDIFDYLLKHDLVEDDVHDLKKLEPRPDSGSRGLTLRELHSIALDIGFAGSDTTSTLLSGIIFQLIRNPDAYRKIADEVRTAFGSADDITVASTAPALLPYLDAVVHETLRTYSPTPLFSGRTVPDGGDTVAGVWLPAGTRVLMSHFVAFQSPLHFAQPRSFIPERWLQMDVGGEKEGGAGRPSEFANDNAQRVFQPFSAGPRNCVGMNLARAETRVALANLLLRFDVGRPPNMSVREGDEWERWIDGQSVWFLFHKGPLMVQLTERKIQ